MIRLPVNVSQWSKIGIKKERYKKMFYSLSLVFIFVTLDHCRDFAKKMREQKIDELRTEVSQVAYDEKSKEEMLRVFGLSNKTN